MSTIVPPFTFETASQKVREYEDYWNTRNVSGVLQSYSPHIVWRNRNARLHGLDEIAGFLQHKWGRELELRMMKELWCYSDDRISARFVFEWHDDSGNWFRSYRNENWEFNEDGLMKTRFSCINDTIIDHDERLFHWTTPTRPPNHPGVSDLDL
ncbi:hypothetical protein MCAP1_003319 [Malassezia caprae]|uniref:DUF1348 domain-containing protein n=1 Tax=Malassezia caprae TaxID=1381934 RepID=A0AAF0EB28_9BASI|nr:hypothetical protein MCAP1_003319 [Malassezia caprae]